MISNLLNKFFTPVRYCSVDTQLTDGKKNATDVFSPVVPRTVCFVNVRSVPFSSDPAPKHDHCPFGNLVACAATSEEFAMQASLFSNFSPIDVVVHRHEDDSIFTFFRICSVGVSWEIFPLEHDWLSVSVVHFTMFWRLGETLNVALPRRH